MEWHHYDAPTAQLITEAMKEAQAALKASDDIQAGRRLPQVRAFGAKSTRNVRVMTLGAWSGLAVCSPSLA